MEIITAKKGHVWQSAMSRVAIMQPTYLPWLGYFDMIDQADIFVFLDSVQLAKRTWQVRNRIKTANGELMLTIPIKKTKTRSETVICEAIIDDDTGWRDVHTKTIEFAYKKSLYFNDVFPFIRELIYAHTNFLSTFTTNIIQCIADRIGIKKRCLFSSRLHQTVARKDTLLVTACKATDCNEYLSAPGSAEYIEKESPGGEFLKEGIDLFYHHYEHPAYNQINGSFLPYMGIIDLLFNQGFDHSLAVIRSGRKPPVNFLDFRKQILRL